MSNIARAYNFMPATLIQSAQVNQELNNLVNLLNGTTSNLETVLVNNDAVNSTLRLNQLAAGPVLSILGASALQGRFMPNAFLQQQFMMVLGPTGSFGSLPAISLGNNGFVYGHTSSDPPLATSGFSVYGTGSNNLFVIHAASALVGSAFTIYQFPDVVQKATWAGNGKLRIRAGFGVTQPGSFTVVGGHLSGDFGTRQSAATGSESTLLSQSIVANVFGVDGEYCVGEYAGFFANNANNKRLRLTYAGTQIFDSGTFAFTNQQWNIKVTIIRISATNVKSIVTFNSGNTTVASATIVNYNNFAVTHSFINTLVSLGTGTTLGDVTQEFFNLHKYSGQ